MDQNLRGVLQQIVNLSDSDKISLALDSIKDIAPELKANFSDEKCSEIIIAVISTAAAADGKLSVQEFALVKSFLEAGGLELEQEKIVRMIADFSQKEAYQMVHALNRILSSDGQASLITLVAAVCAIDDKIDSNEIAYLSDLFEA